MKMIRATAFKNWTIRLRGQGIFIILVFSLTVGLLYGVLLIQNNGQFGEQLLSFTVGQTVVSSATSVFSAFFRALLSLFCFLLVPYVCGFCAIGQIGACACLLFKGLGVGAYLAGFYVQYRWQGIGYCAVAVIPPTVLAILTLLLGCRESIRLSNRIFAVAICGAEGKIGLSAIRLYHVKYLIICLFALFSSLISALFSVWFTGMFELT